MLFAARGQHPKEEPEATRSAVLLAAAQGVRLRGVAGGVPKGFLRLGGRPIVHWSAQKLLSLGIDRIAIVTGHGSDSYDAMVGSWPAIQTIRNPEYADSGSMYSLYCAREIVQGSFLLLESDLVYEMRALQAVFEAPWPNVVLVSGFTDAGGDMYVQTKDDRVHKISREELGPGNADGQFVGICKVSARMFAAMLAYAQTFFRERFYHLDYEDCISRIANEVEVHACKVDDLLWTKIDSDQRLLQATSHIYPQIWAKDGGLPLTSPG